MSLFGKQIREYPAFARVGMSLIVLMGLTRFFVGISGVPYERATHLVSMTNLTLLLFVIYGHMVAAKHFGTYRHLLPTAASLSVAMYGFIVLAILTEGVTGLPGYFHSHSLHNMAANLPPGLTGLISTDLSVPSHMLGQLLAMVLVTFLGWGLASVGFIWSPYLRFLRNGFLALAGLGVFRILLGAAGIPRAVGTWVSSVTLLAMILAVYYGYCAASQGFQRYRQVVLIGFLISLVFNLVVIAGILITTNLMIPNYFNPEVESVNGHIAAHLAASIVEAIPLALLTVAGFLLAKRKPALKSQPAV